MNQVLIIGVMVGLAIVLALYAAWRLYVDLGSAETTYRDRPPTGFRLLWPLVNILANSFGFLLSAERASAIAARPAK